MIIKKEEKKVSQLSFAPSIFCDFPSLLLHRFCFSHDIITQIRKQITLRRCTHTRKKEKKKVKEKEKKISFLFLTLFYLFTSIAIFTVSWIKCKLDESKRRFFYTVFETRNPNISNFMKFFFISMSFMRKLLYFEGWLHFGYEFLKWLSIGHKILDIEPVAYEYAKEILWWSKVRLKLQEIITDSCSTVLNSIHFLLFFKIYSWSSIMHSIHQPIIPLKLTIIFFSGWLNRQ